MGADQTIDYTTTRFEDELRDVDVVLDAVGGDVVERSWRVLRKGGILVSVTKPIPGNEPREHGVRGLFFNVEPDRSQLEQLAKLIDAGSLQSIVASVFPLDRAREAFELGLKGHTRGKIVLRVRDEVQDRQRSAIRHTPGGAV